VEKSVNAETVYLVVLVKNFFKNPVYNEPPPYDYMPVRPAMPLQIDRKQG
jgi:hypothetical protein